MQEKPAHEPTLSVRRLALSNPHFSVKPLKFKRFNQDNFIAMKIL
jgi:hypothetical protein